jgi:PAS domain S-box-containing protein
MMLQGNILGFVGIDNPDFEPLSENDFSPLVQLLADTLSAGRRRSEDEVARRQLNERLTNKTEQQRALLQLSLEMSLATSREGCLTTARHRLRALLGLSSGAKGMVVSLLEKLGGDRCRVRLLDFDPSLEVSLVGFAESDGTHEKEIATEVAERKSSWAALASGTPITTREHRLTDFLDWSRFQEHKICDQCVVVSLLGSSGPFGTLTVGFTRPEPPTLEEIDWIAQVGSTLAAHLSIHEAREALQSLNLALEARVEARTRELRASERRFEQLFHQAPQAMLIVDRARRVVQSNRNAQLLFKVDGDAFSGTPINDLVPAAMRERHDQLMDSFTDSDARAMARGRHVQSVRSDGSMFSAEIGLVPVDLNGERHTIVGISDITDRLEAQAAVAHSLSEKETLLKEIHHRVKNNLQIISSLLMLQSEQMPSDYARKLLEESVFRVRSMALIHHQLYGVESLAQIDFGDYARTLAESLRGALAPHARLRVDASRVEITVETAVPLGLILNELLTNAFKYGLPDWTTGDAPPSSRTGEGCDILVEVEVAEGCIRMAVTDSGRPPKDFDPARTTSLGLELIRTLNRQLLGTLSFDECRGSRFVLTCRHER